MPVEAPVPIALLDVLPYDEKLLCRHREVFSHVLCQLIPEILGIAGRCASLVAHKDKRLSKKLTLMHQTNDTQFIAAGLNK